MNCGTVDNYDIAIILYAQHKMETNFSCMFLLYLGQARTVSGHKMPRSALNNMYQ